jgi:hypothetical protein
MGVERSKRIRDPVRPPRLPSDGSDRHGDGLDNGRGKPGKAQIGGFSCHDERPAEYLQAAAECGFVDAIMVRYTHWLDNDAAHNRALDACHERGVGLISMKQVAGSSDRIFQEVPRRAAALIEKGLTAYHHEQCGYQGEALRLYAGSPEPLRSWERAAP